MAYRISAPTFEWLLEHTNIFGSTDIFPRPFEFYFYQDHKKEIANELSKIDLLSYPQRPGLTYLTPKNLLGFRAADELHPLSHLIYTACTLKLAKKIESVRVEKTVAYSYRYRPNKEFSMFDSGQGYSNWIARHLDLLTENKKYKFVLSTDIADFYQRISHHRLENSLYALEGDEHAVNIIMRQLNTHRTRMSFGIPVGNNASRLLAELLLNDTDQALTAAGFEYSRYVDDFRFFLKTEEEAYRVLAFLAEHLYVTEGLTLSKAKTVVERRQDYISRYTPVDEGKDSEETAIRSLSKSIYESEEPDPEEIEELAAYDLVEKLENELDKLEPDPNRVKVLLSAIKTLRNTEVIPLVLKKINLLLPFMREVILMIEKLSEDEPGKVRKLKTTFFNLLKDGKYYLPITRVWVLELFSKGIFDLSQREFNEIFSSALHESLLETRQLHLVAHQNDITNFFRVRRGSFDHLNHWTSTSFVYGSSCLPTDEYTHWLRSIKPRFDYALRDQFLQWVAL